jgi:hypothetical protein
MNLHGADPGLHLHDTRKKTGGVASPPAKGPAARELPGAHVTGRLRLLRQ